MRLILLVLTCISGLLSCQTAMRDTSEVAPASRHLRSPVGLRDAILTLPAAGLADMSLRGRQLCTETRAGDYHEVARRYWFYSDSPDGGDAKSMFFLRLFEDEGGHTIAASHAARPFADSQVIPSASFTRVYRFADGVWREITDTAFAADVPREAYFRFSATGAPVEYGFYSRKPRVDGQGDFYDFGPPTGRVIWRNGSFQKMP